MTDHERIPVLARDLLNASVTSLPWTISLWKRGQERWWDFGPERLRQIDDDPHALRSFAHPPDRLWWRL